MAQTYEIKANARLAGKGNSRQLRLKRLIPAVVYGPKQQSISITIEEGDAVKYSRHGFENTIFTLTSGDKSLNGLKVLRKDISVHPLTRRPVHLDFLAPDMTQSVRVFVEVRFVGKAEGTKEGGVFNAVAREVEIECLPTEIPEFFELDVTPVQLDESLHVSDLKIPEKFKVITSADQTLCTVAVIAEEVAADPAAADAAAPGAAAPAAGAAAPAAGKDKK